MRRFFTLTLALSLDAVGCATYSQDLERARLHYQANEFPRALAVLRLLGEDEGALSQAEQAQYAYLRGMTDLRLSATVPDPEGQLRAPLRACARDWLERSLKLAPAGALSPDQVGRSRAALEELAVVERSAVTCASTE